MNKDENTMIFQVDLHNEDPEQLKRDIHNVQMLQKWLNEIIKDLLERKNNLNGD